MKKVIALIPPNDEHIITTLDTATKNNWWITYNVEVIITEDKNCDAANMEKVPTIGLLMYGIGGRVYQLTKVEPVHICYDCNNTGSNRVGNKFYCNQHFKKLVVTKPIKRTAAKTQRNKPCPCGSGKKYKHCCISKEHHTTARHYFNSEYKRNEQTKKTA